MNRESKLYATIGQDCTIHLVGWIHTQFPLNPDEVFGQMADFLIGQDAEEIPRLMNLGWCRVYDQIA
jgi:hypothetical protein